MRNLRDRVLDRAARVGATSQERQQLDEIDGLHEVGELERWVTSERDHQQSPRLDQAVVRRLARLGSVEAIAALMRLSARPENHIREASANRLAEIESDEVRDRLIEMANDESAEVRLAVAAGLGGSPASPGRETLEALTRDDDWTVRAAARKSLRS